MKKIVFILFFGCSRLFSINKSDQASIADLISENQQLRNALNRCHQSLQYCTGVLESTMNNTTTGATGGATGVTGATGPTGATGATQALGARGASGSESGDEEISDDESEDSDAEFNDGE